MGAGGARGEGGGRGRGRDAVDAVFGAGVAIGGFFIFMWIIGIPILLAGIGMVASSSSGKTFLIGIALIGVSVLCIIIGVVLVIYMFVLGANKRGPGRGGKVKPTTTVVKSSVPGPTATAHANRTRIQPGGMVIQTHGAQPGYPVYNQPPPVYSQQPSNYPPAGPQAAPVYPPPGSQLQPAPAGPPPQSQPAPAPTLLYNPHPPPQPAYGGVPGEHSMYISDTTNVHM